MLQQYSNSLQQWENYYQIDDYKDYVWVRLGPVYRQNVVNKFYRLIVLDGEAAGTVSGQVELKHEEPYRDY
jgi:hypothetical protein